MASLSMIIEQCTRSILPPCPIHGMWDSRKTSWDGPANKKKQVGTTNVVHTVTFVSFIYYDSNFFKSV